MLSSHFLLGEVFQKCGFQSYDLKVFRRLSDSMNKDQFKILIEDFFIVFSTYYFSEMSKEIINEKVDKIRIAPMLKKSLNKI